MQVPLLRLQCGANSYDWGKPGMSSAAAKFASATNFEVEDGKPYAELWMGTHPSLPSKDLESGRTLLDIVKDVPGFLSQSVHDKYGPKLPFLFKVLSISKALSIQAHPNKKLAEQLHARDSKNYPDDNHKPEMTIAVTPFDGLCGFRPLAEISHFLRNVASLRQLVGDDTAQQFTSAVDGKETSSDEKETGSNKAALQTAFSALMNNALDAPDRLKQATTDLIEDAKRNGSSFAGGGTGPNSGKELADLVIRLDGQFPGDVGLFVLFFLNYVKLEVGEAMFLKADDIHAYLSGDIIECMASSDNVVRAGFTPKYKDVSTLTSMLTYSYAPISEQKMEPEDFSFVKLDRAAYSAASTCRIYDPPIEEFSVVRTELGAGKATFDPIDGPSIVICTGGSGSISVGPTTEDVKTGWVYFVGATAEVVLQSSGDEEPFVTFRAFCELSSPKEQGHSNGKI